MDPQFEQRYQSPQDRHLKLTCWRAWERLASFLKASLPRAAQNVVSRSSTPLAELEPVVGLDAAHPTSAPHVYTEDVKARSRSLVLSSPVVSLGRFDEIR